MDHMIHRSGGWPSICVEKSIVLLLAQPASKAALTVLEAVARPETIGAQKSRVNMALSLRHSHLLELAALKNEMQGSTQRTWNFTTVRCRSGWLALVPG